MPENDRGLILPDPSAPAPIERRNHLLVIGVDGYAHWNKLNNAVRDAKEVKKILEEQYQFEKTKELFENQATRKNILRQLEAYERSLSTDDNLLIYFAGHGAMKENGTTGFWIPFEANKV